MGVSSEALIWEADASRAISEITALTTALDEAKKKLSDLGPISKQLTNDAVKNWTDQAKAVEALQKQLKESSKSLQKLASDQQEVASKSQAASGGIDRFSQSLEESVAKTKMFAVATASSSASVRQAWQEQEAAFARGAADKLRLQHAMREADDMERRSAIAAGNARLNILDPSQIPKTNQSLLELINTNKKYRVAVTQSAAAAEDFMLVFQNAGFGAGLRAMANNVDFLANTFSPLAGAITTVGMITASLLVPHIWNYISGGEEAAKATEKQAKEFEHLADEIKGTSKELIVLGQAEQDRDELKRNMKFNEQEAAARGQLHAAEEAAPSFLAKMTGQRLGSLEHYRAKRDQYKAELADPNLSARDRKNKSAALAVFNEQLKDVDAAEKQIAELRAIREESNRLHAIEKDKRNAKKQFSHVNDTIRASMKAGLASGMSDKDILAGVSKITGEAGFKPEHQPFIGDLVSEALAESKDDNRATQIREKFGLDTKEKPSLSQIRKADLDAKKAALDARKAAREEDFSGPNSHLGAIISPVEQRKLHKEFDAPMRSLEAAIKALNATIAQETADKMRKKAVPPLHVPGRPN